MKKLGHIELADNKVNFVWHELEKPLKNFCLNVVIHTRRMKEYEASKRSIEVSNVKEKYTDCRYEINNKVVYFKNGQSCEAEVTDKAIIIKIN